MTRCFLLAATVSLSLFSWGTLLVRDSVPLESSAGGGYKIGSIDGKNPANSLGEIAGFAQNSYSGGTGVIMAIGDGVAYPPEVVMNESGGSIAIKHTSYSTGDARYVTRPLAASLPASGTYFMSLLLKADASTAEKKGPLYCLKPDGWYGFGFFDGVERPSTSLTSPTNGIHIGFHRIKTSSQNTETGIELALKIAGDFVTLESDVSGENVYFVVVRIEKGAGTDGKDRVTAVVNPSRPIVFDSSSVTAEGEVGEPNRNLFGGAYGTNSFYVRFDEMRVGTELGDVAVISDPDAPIPNAPVVATSPSGGLDYSVSLYQGKGSVYALYGGVDRVYTVTNFLSAACTQADSFCVDVPDSLPLDLLYAYGVMAVSEDGATTNVVDGGYFYNGVPTLAVIAHADERDLRAGELDLTVPAGVQTFNIDMAYTISGSAVAGVNYEAIAESMTFQAGTDYQPVMIVPKRADPADADTEVVFTLQGGCYRLGATPPSATVRIRNARKADGTIYFMEQFPLAAVDHPGYVANNSMQGAKQLNASRSRGAIGNWFGGTNAYSTRDFGLSYPDEVAMESAGGAFAWHYLGGYADSRWLFCTLADLPTAGTYYFSALLRATASAYTSMTSKYWRGFGLTPDRSLSYGAQTPTNGVFVGFRKSEGAKLADVTNVTLSVYADGEIRTLLAEPATNVAHFIVGRVELGAGTDGKDRLTLVANPTSGRMFSSRTAVTLEGDCSSCTNLVLGGTYIVGEVGAVVIDEILVADSLDSVARMKSAGGLAINIR